MSTVADLPGTWKYLRDPSMTIDDNGQGGYISSLAFSVDYANWGDFILTIAGTSTPITTSWGSINRVVPLQHPIFSGMYASRIRSSATGEASGTGVTQMYSHAKVSVEFSSVKYNTSGDDAYMTLEVEKGATYSTQPGRKFFFPGGEPIDQDAGQWAVTNNYVLTLFQCPGLNDTELDLAAGKVNVATFLGRPAGTVLFGGCRGIIERTTGGVITYQRSMTFAYRSYAWNLCFQRDGTLDTPVDPDGNLQYEEYDLNGLFD